MTRKKKFVVRGLGVLSVLLLMGQGCFSLAPQDGVETTSGPAGMFLSVDKGETWGQISLLPQADGVKSLSQISVYRLSEDPQDPRALYWGSRGQGLYYTYDDGRSWQQPGIPLTTGFIYAIAVHPEDKCIVYATDGARVYRTIDCSRSWAEVYHESQDDRVISVAFNRKKPQEIFLAKEKGDLLRSVDSGLSWQVIQRFRTNLGMVDTDPVDEKRVYMVSRTKGLFRSDDGGSTWVSLVGAFKDFSGAIQFRRFFVHPTKANVIYWVSDFGILRSDNGGDSWYSFELITPPGSAKIYGFAINPKNENEMYYTATIGTRSTLYKTVDGGGSWITKKLPSGQIPTVLRIHPNHDNYLYLGFTIPEKA